MAVGIYKVSTDEIRLSRFGVEHDQRINGLVFGLAKKLVAKALDSGAEVCFDATNIKPQSRSPFIKLGMQRGVAVVGVWFDCSAELAIERQTKRQRKVPDDVIRRMTRDFVPPAYSEGFDCIWRVSSY